MPLPRHQGGDNTASEIISFEVDSEEYEKATGKYSREKIIRYLKNGFRALTHDDLKGPGVFLKCPGCDHEWLYKGVEWKTRCNRCGTKIHTGIKPQRDPKTGHIEWRLEE